MLSSIVARAKNSHTHIEIEIEIEREGGRGRRGGCFGSGPRRVIVRAAQVRDFLGVATGKHALHC